MRIEQVKKAMRNKTLVSYDCSYICGNNFYITGCILRLLNGVWHYQLELLDLDARTNSVIIADMEKVELREYKR